MKDPGLYPGLSFADYLAAPGLNFSLLKNVERSLLHARYAQTHPEAPTTSQGLGQAVHVAILEPERFDETYASAPKIDGTKSGIDRRTKKGKDAWAKVEAEHPDCEILTPTDWDTCMAMRKAVAAHPIAGRMIAGPAHREVSALWEAGGLRWKGRLDLLCEWDGWSWVVDLKTTDDASPQAWGRKVAQYAYHGQAALYLEGCNVIAPRERRFGWLVVEKDPPHGVCLYEADLEALDVGRNLVAAWAQQWAKAEAEGSWPGYETEIQPVSLPRWALPA